MNSADLLRFSAPLLGAVTLALSTGCNPQTRGNADATGSVQAATPEEGGSTSVKGAAGEPRNFGDLDAKRRYDEASPSGKSMVGGASTGPDYSLDMTRTPTGEPALSRANPGESHNAPEPVKPVKP